MSTSQPFHSIPKPENLPEALSVIKQQSYNIKLLQNEHQIKDQHLDILKERILELERSVANYQTQVSNLEETFDEYRQEFQLKVQAEAAQNLRLREENQGLENEKRELGEKIKQLEEHQVISKESFQAIYDEIQDLRYRGSRAQQAILDARDQLYQKQNELVEVEKRMHQVNMENDELKENNRLLLRENQELGKVLSEKTLEMEEFIRMNQEYKSLKQTHESEMENMKMMKENHEKLKRQYEELEHMHGLKLLEEKQHEANEKNKNTKIEGLQKQVEKLKEILSQKDLEIQEKSEEVLRSEENEREEEAAFVLGLKRAKELIKARAIECEELHDINSISQRALNELLQLIVKQNRQFLNLKEAQIVEEEEYQYLERLIEELGREKDELMKINEQLLKDYEELEKNFQEAEELAVLEKKELQLMFEKEFEKMIGLVSEADGKSQEELALKEEEILQLLEEKANTKEYLAAQEANVQELQGQCESLAEDVVTQKRKIEKIGSVLAVFVGVFVNLLAQFKNLAGHKEFTEKYFWRYHALKERLVQRGLISSTQEEEEMEKTPLAKLRRCVLATKAALRLKRLGESHNEMNVDQLEIKANLDSFPPLLKRLVVNLFMHQNEDLIGGVFEGVNQVIEEELANTSENYVLSRIISIIGLLNKTNEVGDWEEQKKRRYVHECDKIEFEINTNGDSKIKLLEKRLMENEEFLAEEERRYQKETDDLIQQLDEARGQATMYKDSNDKLVNEFDNLKDEVMELLTWIKEQGKKIYSQQELDEEGMKENQETAKLQEKVNNLQRNILAVRRNNYKIQKHDDRQKKGDRENQEEMIERGTEKIDWMA